MVGCDELTTEYLTRTTFKTFFEGDDDVFPCPLFLLLVHLSLSLSLCAQKSWVKAVFKNDFAQFRIVNHCELYV